VNEIESLLIKAWKMAIQNGDTKLAEAIVSLPGMFVSSVQEQRPCSGSQTFKIPSGKYKGKLLNQLDAIELQNVWSGFNGCGNHVVANALKAEINIRLSAKRARHNNAMHAELRWFVF